MNFSFSSPSGKLVAEYPLDTNRVKQLNLTLLACQTMGIASISSSVQVELNGVTKDAEIIVRSQSESLVLVMMLEISPGTVYPVTSTIEPIESLRSDSTKIFKPSPFEAFLQHYQPQTRFDHIKGA